MTHPVAMHSFNPPQIDAFMKLTEQGLFCAPWMAPADPGEAGRVQALSGRFLEHGGDSDKLASAFGHLLAVRYHCLRAAGSRDSIAIRAHYQEAMKRCQAVLTLLHNAVEGTEGALLEWAQGVHTLIMGQMAMPNEGESRRYALEAKRQLSLIQNPVCTGAQADATAAGRLAAEPGQLAGRLQELAQRIREAADAGRAQIARQEAVLNERLHEVRAAHQRALQAVLIWGVIHLALLASVPLNAFLDPETPWSLPFLIAIPVLWYFTWGRPFRDGLYFFAWVRSLRLQSLAEFHRAFAALHDGPARFRADVADLLEEAHHDAEQLERFYLYLPGLKPDPLAKSEEAARAGAVLVQGQWMAELEDRAPWPVRELLPIEPSMLPKATRIWYGK